MKRVLACILALVLLISMIPLTSITASAATNYTLNWPVPTNVAAIGRYSSAFGPRKAPTSGASTNHRGIDIPVPKNTPVYSAADGIVKVIGKSNARGNYVLIYHPSIGLSTLYQHLTNATVQVGATVSGGQQIALSGNTGVGTGAHLHFGVMKGQATKADHDQPSHNMAINPLGSDITYVASNGGQSQISNNPDEYTYPTVTLKYTSPTMKGDGVAWVQAVLYQLGYSIEIDGSYGQSTVAIIEQFQNDYGLTVDGYCGPDTRAMLLKLWEAKKHTHNWTYSHYDTVHPHCNIYICSCGESFVDSNSANYYSKCSTCSSVAVPGKPTVTNIYSATSADYCIINWETPINTDYYEVHIYNATNGQKVHTVWNTVSTCYITQLPTGEYYLIVAAINSSLVDTGYQYFTHSDSYYFSVSEFTNVSEATPGKPIIKNVYSASSADYCIMNWETPINTDYYEVHIYNATNGQKVHTVWNTVSTCYTTQLPVGVYYFIVTAINSSLVDTGYQYFTHSDAYYFSISEGMFAPTESVTYNGSKYVLYDITMTYEKAKSKCEELGGHLVTITSAEEQAIIHNLITSKNKKVYWLGLTDEDSEGAWKNITNESVAYTNWSANEPNNSQNYDSKDYAVIDCNSGEWNTVNSYNTFYYATGFICEYEPITITYDTNGSDDKIPSIIKVHNENACINIRIPTRQGYKFIGWTTSDHSEVAVYQPGDIITTNTDLVLYAIWQPTALFGDGNDDGEINALDLTAIINLILSNKIDYESNITCDTNGDGVINLLDLVRLKKYLAGISTVLGK